MHPLLFILPLLASGVFTWIFMEGLVDSLCGRTAFSAKTLAMAACCAASVAATAVAAYPVFAWALPIRAGGL